MYGQILRSQVKLQISWEMSQELGDLESDKFSSNPDYFINSMNLDVIFDSLLCILYYYCDSLLLSISIY